MSDEFILDSTEPIKNPVFQKYARIYSDIYANYLGQVKTDGLELDDRVDLQQVYHDLKTQGVLFRNDDKSLYLNWISPACEACRKGVNSVTFYLSLKCHRNCYYCFNPNQEDYDYYQENVRDCLPELDQLARSGQKVDYIALTGGEPLLHREDTIAFFRHAREKFRRAHTRLYTSGDLLDQDLLQDLKDAGLDEIRFSIKLEDSPARREKVYERIALAVSYIPDVMVEMPVIPGTLPEMKELLDRLQDLRIKGINLLEFCYPFHNVAEFQKRSFKVKNPPFATLYNYWYAGGLPVSQSEADCLELLNYARGRNYEMGVHFCSLENKHTGQVFQQNQKHKTSSLAYFSPNDFFLKTAKVFGDDIDTVLKVFKKKKVTAYRLNAEHQFLEFHVKEIGHLKGLSLEVGLSFNIWEERQDGAYMRELKIEPVNPDTFDIKSI